jgi:hypothetical protein
LAIYSFRHMPKGGELYASPVWSFSFCRRASTFS